MRISSSLLLHSAALLSLIGVTSPVHAATDESHVSAMRYVSLDVSGDNADSRQYSGTGSFTLGRYVWLQGTVGKLKDESGSGLGDLTNYGTGVGAKGEHLQFSINYSHYKNDTEYVQRDVTAALDWVAKRYSVGLDVFHRASDDAATKAYTDTFPFLGTTTIRARAEQELTGKGFGAHATFNITDQLSASLGGISYSYDKVLRISSDVTTSLRPAIAAVLEPRINAGFQQRIISRSSSGVTRNVTPLDSSYNLGVSYLFDAASVSAQYIRDKILDSDNATNTFTVGASVFVGEHWILSPMIGQSNSDATDDVTFGGLSVSYNW